MKKISFNNCQIKTPKRQLSSDVNYITYFKNLAKSDRNKSSNSSITSETAIDYQRRI